MPITKETLAPLKKGRVFVETGCLEGAGIQAALDVGFSSIISIELDLRNVWRAQNRFQHKPVTILHGDSVAVLPSVLNELDEPCTFWLDAHSDYFSPVLTELRLIADRGIKNHTILIDDRRLMYGTWSNMTEDAVRSALLAINPDYVITLVDGYEPNDIIVAQER